jgi:hypothetical protein
MKRARPIAEGLMANGVNTFFDEWSIEPGDSLRRRIEAGIAGANYFVALISENSLQSEWVQTELDMALIAKIEGQSRLVPLFFGIQPERAPLSIRSVTGITVEGIDDTVRRLVSLCPRATVSSGRSTRLFGASIPWTIQSSSRVFS